ncbi:UNVERIFIED_CONTAM: sporulation protein YqfC [Acetivibrio alkalicellulosi]
MSNKKRENRKKNTGENKKRSIKEKMTEFLELPKEIVLDMPKTTLLGNGNMLVENYKGIIEYDVNRIRINTSKGIIKVTGDNLFIKEITSEDLMIYGDIASVEFLK